MNTLIWLPDAARAVTRAIWPPRRSGRRWFLFGGIGFWLVIFLAWIYIQAFKAAVWLIILAVLTITQIITYPFALVLQAAT